MENCCISNRGAMMSKDDDTYTPISCADYDAYEVAIMHGQRLRTTWRDDDGLQHIESLAPKDLQTRDGEEYLIAVTCTDRVLRLRLDRIIKSVPLD